MNKEFQVDSDIKLTTLLTVIRESDATYSRDQVYDLLGLLPGIHDSLA
jgi:hypothetical protein